MQPLVTVQTYSRVIDARLAQARLEGAGIRTFLLDESLASIDPFLINAIGGVKLQVELDDEQAARELLSQPLGDADDEVDESVPRCPRCDSEYVFETGGDGKAMECRRCGFKGSIEEFAPTARTRAVEPSHRPHDASPESTPPVFRLERRRGLVGGVLGFVAGLVVTVIFAHEIGAFALLLGTLLGVVVGRSRRYWVCSEPTCRGPIRPDDGSCDRCKRKLRGTITREGEHFVQVTEWKRLQAKLSSPDG